MAQILDTFIEFFEEDEWPYLRLDDSTILSTGFSGENGQWSCFVETIEDAGQAMFYSIFPKIVAEEIRISMAEFLSRANYGLVIGNFELDFSDGEVRFRTSIDVEGGEISLPLVENLVLANVSLMDRYYPGINSVIEGEMSPEDAIKQMEG